MSEEPQQITDKAIGDAPEQGATRSEQVEGMIWLLPAVPLSQMGCASFWFTKRGDRHPEKIDNLTRAAPCWWLAEPSDETSSSLLTMAITALLNALTKLVRLFLTLNG